MIRTARRSDAETIAAIHAPFVTGSTVSFEIEPPDAGEMGERLGAHPTMPWLVAAPAGDRGGPTMMHSRSRDY